MGFLIDDLKAIGSGSWFLFCCFSLRRVARFGSALAGDGVIVCIGVGIPQQTQTPDNDCRGNGGANDP
jgi:hypothetical protein